MFVAFSKILIFSIYHFDIFILQLLSMPSEGTSLRGNARAGKMRKSFLQKRCRKLSPFSLPPPALPGKMNNLAGLFRN
jgi:hypothetical protein